MYLQLKAKQGATSALGEVLAVVTDVQTFFHKNFHIVGKIIANCSVLHLIRVA